MLSKKMIRFWHLDVRAEKLVSDGVRKDRPGGRAFGSAPGLDKNVIGLYLFIRKMKGECLFL